MSACNHAISSTNRTTARAEELSPVGRYGVARNVRLSDSAADCARRVAASRRAPVRSLCSMTCPTSASRRAASARQAAVAAARKRSPLGVGQRKTMAGSDAAPASAQPASRSGICEAGAGIETGRMNARSIATVADASTELTTPAKSTQNPTTVIAVVATQTEFDASVPRHHNTAPAGTSASCERNRSTIVPEKSTSRTIANDPNAANVATAGFPITLSPIANIAGTTTAPRAALRSPTNPGSRARTHATTRPGPVVTMRLDQMSCSVSPILTARRRDCLVAPGSGRPGFGAVQLRLDLVDRQPLLPDRVERDLQDSRERAVLDDDDGQLGAAGDRVLHAEHDDRLVDDHELQRQLRHEARLLARRDEAADAFRERRIVERRVFVDAARPVHLRDLEPLDVLLCRRRVRRLGEDENLVLDPGLELVEPLVDRGAIAEHLDVLERVALLLPFGERRPERLDHLPPLVLQPFELLASICEQPLDGRLGIGGGVLHR